MLYTPITIEQYLEEKTEILHSLEKDSLDNLEPMDAQRVRGRLDMLKIVIADLKIILAGPVEIP